MPLDFTPVYGQRDFTPDDSNLAQVSASLNPLDSFFGEAKGAYSVGTGTSLAYSGLELFNPDDSRTISPEEANKEFPAEGLQFNSPISTTSAALMQQRKQEELKNQDIQQNSSLGKVGSFFAGLTGTMADPVDFALNFTPMGWAERTLGIGKVAMLGKGILDRAGIRTAQGALAGTTGAAIGGGLDWAAATQEQRDYGLNDFLQNLAFGGVMGAALHVPLGALGDAVEKGGVVRKINQLLPEDSQVEALKLANQGVYNFNDILGIQAPIVEKELTLGRDLSVPDRLRVIHGLDLEPEKLPTEGEQPPPTDDLTSPKEVTPEQIQAERSQRIKDLLGDSASVPVDNTDNVRTPLTSDEIAKTGDDLDENISTLEKQNQELDAIVGEYLKPEEEAPKGELTPEQQAQQDILEKTTTPMLPELEDFHNEGKAEIDKAQSNFDALGDREKGFRAMAACALNTLA